ncbi:DUF6585 family protein [Tengunoibacter tsumagoiensis]|uniref:Uncharacterized protein n=1 Tax=Tengunoibacter tsumagoiensis TaxID=2014871 RepID=A0A401ZYU6_9CHLR|nr:DUF6585 family protein [Tengunoibacter tsumagoiensis]GCE12015.1 hypothetical protein KTT_18740 [Tengunoibacter tsumagoiensis]
MEPGQQNDLSMTTHDLAEQYQVGQPLARYTMFPQWIRFWQVYRRLLLDFIIFSILIALAIVLLFLAPLFQGQIGDLQFRLLLGLAGIISGLIGCVNWLLKRNMIAQSIPTSLLVCTKGLLAISLKAVDVTLWDEVIGTLQIETGKRKRYKLQRINRKPLTFHDAYEDSEALVDLIRQQLANPDLHRRKGLRRNRHMLSQRRR